MKNRRKRPGLITRLFTDLYTVKLYIEEDGVTTQTIYRLKELKKINSHYLKGVLEDGTEIEFRMEKSFDYKVVKHY